MVIKAEKSEDFWVFKGEFEPKIREKIFIFYDLRPLFLTYIIYEKGVKVNKIIRDFLIKKRG